MATLARLAGSCQVLSLRARLLDCGQHTEHTIQALGISLPPCPSPLQAGKGSCGVI